MSKAKQKVSSLLSAVMALSLMLCAFTGTSALASGSDLSPGEYTVDASLSCYVNAMGGIEFGKNLFSGMQVTVKEDGTRTATLNFKDDSSLTIYTINAHCFINPDKSPVGFYDANGNLNTTDVSFTRSANTATDPSNNQVHYLESMTFDLPSVSDTYLLYLYVDSQIMGVQFCDGNGISGSNRPNETTPYQAVLTVDWSSAASGSVSSQSSSVVYDYASTGTYEVSIPATIQVDKATKTGSYEVTATNFDIPEGAYVTVTAETSGSLYYDGNALAFTNELSSGQLKATGDKLSGTITITDTPTVPGTYEGVTNFTIKYVSGE